MSIIHGRLLNIVSLLSTSRNPTISTLMSTMLSTICSTMVHIMVLLMPSIMSVHVLVVSTLTIVTTIIIRVLGHESFVAVADVMKGHFMDSTLLLLGIDNAVVRTALLVVSVRVVFFSGLPEFVVVVAVFLLVVVVLAAEALLVLSPVVVVEVVVVLVLLLVVAVVEIVVEGLVLAVLFLVVDVLEATAFVPLVFEDFAADLISLLSMTCKLIVGINFMQDMNTQKKKL